MENIEYNGIIIHFNRVYDYDMQGSETEAMLMTHPIYFLQNGFDSNRIVEQEEMKIWYLDPIKAAKALLLLHSIPFNYGNPSIDSFFNSDKTSNVGYEVVPYGMLALMGGLLYRKMYFDETNIDIIYTGDVYKKPSMSQTFLVEGKKEIHFGVIMSGSSKEYLPINMILSDNIDIYIKNKLIELFVKFVQETSNEIDSLEIKCRNKVVIGNRVEKVTKYKNKTTGEEFSEFEYNIECASGRLKPEDYIKLENDEIIPLTSINISRYNYLTFTKMLQMLIGKNYSEVTKYLHDNAAGFVDKYLLGVIRNRKLWMYYKEDDIKLQGLFDKLYNHKCSVVTLVCQTEPNTDCIIDKYSFNAVVNGFTNTMNKLISEYKKEEANKKSIDVTESKNNADDDLKKSIYLYMKQFWDKWLCSVFNDTSKHYDKGDIKPFTVEWFGKQFLFIDTLYNDISTSLKLNCKELLDMYESSVNGDSESGIHVLNHLANIAERHHCNFFCYPDFINFNKVDKNGKKEAPEQILADLFTPIPYNEINPVSAENQFVVIRVSNSQITGNKTQFNNDGFDIWSNSDSTAVAPSTFQNSIKSNYDNNRDELRMAYKVPSFGVAFSRQDNSLFKTIDVGMDTQQITEQSVKTMCQISQLGNNNKRAVTFYGNDIFGVYSAYSYIVTITMMGDAQIQPLMYFQLMNIPMFRGTYMVIEVKHSIKVGEFTTIFKGMKMSKIEPPLSSAWFTIEPEDSDGKNSKNDNCGGNQVNSDGSPAPKGTVY